MTTTERIQAAMHRTPEAQFTWGFALAPIDGRWHVETLGGETLPFSPALLARLASAESGTLPWLDGRYPADFEAGAAGVHGGGVVTSARAYLWGDGVARTREDVESATEVLVEFDAAEPPDTPGAFLRGECGAPVGAPVVFVCRARPAGWPL